MLVAITLLAVMAVIDWRALDSPHAQPRAADRPRPAGWTLCEVLYGQFQADCEHLATPVLLQASPLELGARASC